MFCCILLCWLTLALLFGFVGACYLVLWAYFVEDCWVGMVFVAYLVVLMVYVLEFPGVVMSCVGLFASTRMLCVRLIVCVCIVFRCTSLIILVCKCW